MRTFDTFVTIQQYSGESLAKVIKQGAMALVISIGKDITKFIV